MKDNKYIFHIIYYTPRAYLHYKYLSRLDRVTNNIKVLLYLQTKTCLFNLEKYFAYDFFKVRFFMTN